MKEKFQSTFPHGERRATGHIDTGTILSFNPRSRTGNDAGVADDLRQLVEVSIHVPARGTTMLLHVEGYTKSVSIHVPARGTTAIIHKFPLCFLLLSMQLYQ